jgi:hypothetical protein
MKEMAERLGVSRQLIGKLFSRGYTTKEIEARVELRRAKAEARMGDTPNIERVNGHTNGHDLDEFPTVPIVPTFAESEKRKEYYLSEIRRAEAAKLHQEMLPVQPLPITVMVARFRRDILERWPEELGPELAMRSREEIARVLGRRIESLFQASKAFFEGECRKYGLTPPPEPPLSPPSPDHERRLHDPVLPVAERILRGISQDLPIAPTLPTAPLESSESPEWPESEIT